MSSSRSHRPVVMSPDNKFIQAIPTNDYIAERYLDSWSPATTVLSEVVVQYLSSSVTGQAYTLDYPHRHEITGRFNITAPKVDNLVQSPVEIVAGTWKLGYVVDEYDQDKGTYPAYVYEIPQSAVTGNRLAIDYFHTWHLRNGTTKYWYDGTAYFEAENIYSNFRLFASSKNYGFGTNTVNPTPENPGPEDVISSEAYVIPRKLKPGEQAQNIITTTNGWVTGKDYFSAINKSPLLA